MYVCIYAPFLYRRESGQGWWDAVGSAKCLNTTYLTAAGDLGAARVLPGVAVIAR